MDLEAASAKDGARWAWARTGALALFLLTAILLITSLNVAPSNDNGGAARAQYDTEAVEPLPRS